MAKIKLGSTVRQIVPAPVQGIVTKVGIDESTGDRQYEVSWQGPEGQQATYFNEDQLEVVE